MVSDCASVEKDHRILSLLQVFHNHIHSIILSLGVIWLEAQIDRRLQSLALELLLSHIRRQTDIDRSRLDIALSDRAVDQHGCFVGIIQHGHCARNVVENLPEHCEVAISEGVME